MNKLASFLVVPFIVDGLMKLFIWLEIQRQLLFAFSKQILRNMDRFGSTCFSLCLNFLKLLVKPVFFVLAIFSFLLFFLLLFFLLIIHILSDFLMILLSSVPLTSSTRYSFTAYILRTAQLILYPCVRKYQKILHALFGTFDYFFAAFRVRSLLWFIVRALRRNPLVLSIFVPSFQVLHWFCIFFLN